MPLPPLDWVGTLDDLFAFAGSGFGNATAGDALAFAVGVSRRCARVLRSTCR